MAKIDKNMNQIIDSTESGQNRIKCPFCAELILPDARICRFCKSDLKNNIPAGKDESASQKPVTMARAMVLNLVCPGLGAWKIGHRIRGAIIFAVVIGFLIIYANEIMPVINKAVNTAVRTGNMTRLNHLSKELEQNRWLDWSIYVYAYSFIELFFLTRAAEKKEKETDEK